jgi:hypothetical protein
LVVLVCAAGRRGALARDWLSDLLLFFCLAAFIVGIVVAASLAD